MRKIFKLIGKYIDFHFVLVLVVIFGTAGSLYLQFAQADVEFETLNGSMYSIVRSQKTMDDRESSALSQQLDQIENELDALILNQK